MKTTNTNGEPYGLEDLLVEYQWRLGIVRDLAEAMNELGMDERGQTLHHAIITLADDFEVLMAAAIDWDWRVNHPGLLQQIEATSGEEVGG